MYWKLDGSKKWRIHLLCSILHNAVSFSFSSPSLTLVFSRTIARTSGPPAILSGLTCALLKSCKWRRLCTSRSAVQAAGSGSTSSAIAPFAPASPTARKQQMPKFEPRQQTSPPSSLGQTQTQAFPNSSTSSSKLHTKERCRVCGVWKSKERPCYHCVELPTRVQARQRSRAPRWWAPRNGLRPPPLMSRSAAILRNCTGRSAQRPRQGQRAVLMGRWHTRAVGFTRLPAGCGAS
jgi:hypothetical protein